MMVNNKCLFASFVFLMINFSVILFRGVLRKEIGIDFPAIDRDMVDRKNQFTTTKQPRCEVLTSQHNEGKWIRTQFESEATWPCCDWDGGFLNYPQECGPFSGYRLLNSGRVNDTGSFTGNQEFFAHAGGSGCLDHCEPINGSIISAEWTPFQCDLPKFDAEHFYNNVLRDRTIAVIGDSTMEQTAATLMNAVHYQCPQRIRFIEGGPLVGKKHRANYTEFWYDSARHFDVDIVILAAGPYNKHVEEYQLVLDDVYKGYFNEFASSGKVMIWKTINPGGSPEFPMMDHVPDFTNSSVVQQWRTKGYHPDVWRWDLFQRFDEMAKTYFRDRGVAVLDVKPLYHRVDNHPRTDIHHCAHGNGALRVIPRLLQSLLEEIK